MRDRRYVLEQDPETPAKAADVVEIPLPPQRSDLSVANAIALQRAIGNAAFARLVEPKGPDGEDVYGGAHAGHSHGAPVIGQGAKNEFGELEGELETGLTSCLFLNGGKVGEGIVYWNPGGTGGQGQQHVGSIDLTPPEYEGSDGTSGGPAEAWIKPGTGIAKVTRSYKGVVLGPNGVFYFTAAAVARADVHEQLHVASSKSLHDQHIAPLEARVAQHTGKSKGLKGGATKAEAIEALKKFVDWNGAVQKFQTDDAAANVGGGTVDATDMARPDFVVNYGPRTVNGVAFDNYIDMAPGPPATPAKAGGTATAAAGTGT